MFELRTGKTIDLARALPMELGDWRALKKDHAITVDMLADLFSDPDKAATFLLFVLRKADSGATEADVNSLSTKQISKIIEAINASEKEGL